MRNTTPRRRICLTVHNPVITNPFAVLGLSADATGGEIHAVSQQAAMRAKLSGSSGNSGGEDLSRVRLIERAAEQLRDPIQRFEHGLFWVTLSPEELAAWRSDPTLMNMATNWRGGITDQYLSLASSGGLDIRSHNLAVMYLAEAIAMDSGLVQAELAAPDESSRKLWKLAFQHWAMSLHSDTFWERMNQRCNSIDDPRLTRSFLDDKRNHMPRLVLHSCRELSSHRLLEGDASGTLAYVDLLRNSPFSDEDCESCLSEIYQPLTDRIEHVVGELENDHKLIDSLVLKQPKFKDKAVMFRLYGTVKDSFHLRLQPQLITVMEVGDLPGYAEEHARDMAAKFLRSLAVSIHNNECPGNLSESLLDLSVKYVDASSLRGKYHEEKEIVIRNNALKSILNPEPTKDEGYEKAIGFLDLEIKQQSELDVHLLKQLRERIVDKFITSLFQKASNCENARNFSIAKSLLDTASKYASREEDIQHLKSELKRIDSLELKSSSSMHHVTATTPKKQRDSAYPTQYREPLPYRNASNPEERSLPASRTTTKKRPSKKNIYFETTEETSSNTGPGSDDGVGFGCLVTVIGIVIIYIFFAIVANS